MADFDRRPAAPPIVAPPRIEREEDLTHRVNGPLGSMAVVPDDFAGPMPPNAVRRSDYARMERVYGNIDAGQSSLQFDTSSFFKDAAGKDLSLLQDPMAYMRAIGEAAKFREQYMGYIQDLVKTPAGLQLLEQLDQSKHSTTIGHTTGGNFAIPETFADGIVRDNGMPNVGTEVNVLADPSATEWDGENCQHGDQPWMADRPRFGFYHELVHAYHFTRGDNVGGPHSHAACTDFPAELANWEWQAAGLGPWAGSAVSENAIRAQMGAPLRPTYSGARYDGPDPWKARQQRDDEEPPRRSPARRDR